MCDWLWGLKTVALFDVWSVEHIFSGVSVGSAVRHVNHACIGELLNSSRHGAQSLYFDITGVLFFAFSWEALEHYLEAGLIGLGVELHLKLTQVLHLKVTHLEEPEYGSSVLGFSSFCLLGFLRRAVFEAVAIVAGFNDVAVMSQPVE